MRGLHSGTSRPVFLPLFQGRIRAGQSAKNPRVIPPELKGLSCGWISGRVLIVESTVASIKLITLQDLFWCDACANILDLSCVNSKTQPLI